jgi:hypothetical protein
MNKQILQGLAHQTQWDMFNEPIMAALTRQSSLVNVKQFTAICGTSSGTTRASGGGNDNNPFSLESLGDNALSNTGLDDDGLDVEHMSAAGRQALSKPDVLVGEMNNSVRDNQNNIAAGQLTNIGNDSEDEDG